MKSLLVPVFLALLGLGGGVGAGLFLRPHAEEMVALPPCGPDGQPMLVAGNHSKAPEAKVEELGTEGDPTKEFVKLNNQFIVPVVREGKVVSMVVLSLSIEIDIGGRELVYGREPKLRDVFLQVLFDHANSGGFSGNFTDGTKMRRLSEALREVARKVLGETASDVLIVDIVRQDS
ncbi:flagellar basal body-associated FliL family protein [Vannielia sp.]|uniref:flagellar basal body-associated FliL family protein n=1 Tax=Vannielia sp. TaxID=2813045 RepID=UPI0026266EBF|nr:flagellar basal body-associated FliL family protein [Vannielia sp.]MDF1871731.1 flagellar basal body-associated FliL family protein [Vannielia sp.]